MSEFQHVSMSARPSRLALQLGVAAVLGYWAVTVYRLGGLWSALPEYSYGWAVPMLCVILFLDRWRTRPIRTQPCRRSRFSVGFLLAAVTVFVFARLAIEINPMWRLMAWGVSFATLGITYGALLLVGGGTFARHFFFPVFFFLLAVPWHTRIEVPFIQMLTELNATLTVEVMAFLKVAAVRMGNIILIEPGRVGVQEACSGIRSFQSTLMVSLFLGELFRFGFWRRVVFVFVGAMLSFGFNIVRTSFLVWTCNREGLQAVDKFHDPAGWTILAASVVGLGLIGWWLYRQQSRERGAGSGERDGKKLKSGNAEMLKGGNSSKAETLKSEILNSDESRAGHRNTETPDPRPQTLAPRPQWSVVLVLLFTLIVTELGIRWWFGIHKRPTQMAALDWRAQFDSERTGLNPLKISREVQAMLDYDGGSGWEWQGGGSERWQAFYFVWDEPKTLSRRIACMTGALGHQPELCFTRAGMQLRRNFGKKSYVANGVPLVFKVYEFTDRNIPIFVFACTWERNAKLAAAEEMNTAEVSLSSEGLQGVFMRLARGERGVTDEVRVLKLGVWGPRTIGEAEAAFQQQLNLLVQPKGAGGGERQGDARG